MNHGNFLIGWSTWFIFQINFSNKLYIFRHSTADHEEITCCSDGEQTPAQPRKMVTRRRCSSAKLRKTPRPPSVRARRGSLTDSTDPHMSDLIAHMFLYEKTKAKDEENERARKAAGNK